MIIKKPPIIFPSLDPKKTIIPMWLLVIMGLAVFSILCGTFGQFVFSFFLDYNWFIKTIVFIALSGFIFYVSVWTPCFLEYVLQYSRMSRLISQEEKAPRKIQRKTR